MLDSEHTVDESTTLDSSTTMQTVRADLAEFTKLMFLGGSVVRSMMNFDGLFVACIFNLEERTKSMRLFG